MASARTRMQARILGGVVALACVATPIFNLLTTGEWISIGQGILDGLLISLVAGGYLLFVRDGLLRVWLRRFRFATNLLINSAVLTAIFLVGRGLGQVIVAGGDPAHFMISFRDDHLPYAALFFVAISVGLMFVLQMNRMIGPNVLRYFVTGAYHRPRDEERVFLFLDLKGSTRLARELGSDRYYALLRRFVDDLSEPVLAHRGQIYQYAGDEVVITWPLAEGVADARALRCYFAISDAIERAAPAYEAEFGARPEFRVGLHGGPVIAGELGDLKQEIVYVGDTLNVAARLEEHAKHTGLGLVVSDELLARMPLPDDLRIDALGSLDVRGRDEGVAASHVARPAD